MPGVSNMADVTASVAVALPPHFTFVVIGYNEAPCLSACLKSVHAARFDGFDYELLYVDGGSTDDSIQVAYEARADLVLGGDRQRRAAENRNLGLRHAQGEYVQFLDGDMVLDPEWPLEARQVLESNPDVAVVFGRLEEQRKGALYEAFQIDWEQPEGETLYCGGAALFVREAIQKAGGFPEDVAYGEEPLLCWRLRNEFSHKIYHSRAKMADHDLAYKGFRDYHRRNIRVGRAFAEIASRCRGSKDPFWSAEQNASARWGIGLVVLALMLLAPSSVLRVLVVSFMLGVILRKALQVKMRGRSWRVALIYALHTYLAKIGIAWGILIWFFRKRQAA